MNTFLDVIRGSGREDSGLTCMARVLGNGGTPITQDSIGAITCKVYDLSAADTTAVVVTPVVVVAAAISDSLNTSVPWTDDDIGSNFRFTLPATALPTGDHQYRAEFIFDPIAGDDFGIVFEIYAAPLTTS